MLLYLADYRPRQRMSTTLSDDPTTGRHSSKCRSRALYEMGVSARDLVICVRGGFRGRTLAPDHTHRTDRPSAPSGRTGGSGQKVVETDKQVLIAFVAVSATGDVATIVDRPQTSPARRIRRPP